MPDLILVPNNSKYPWTDTSKYDCTMSILVVKMSRRKFEEELKKMKKMMQRFNRKALGTLARRMRNSYYQCFV